MMLAALTFGPASLWTWLALAAAVVLVPLGWLALQPAGARSRTLAVGLALRTLGLGLLVLCLLDPQWTAQRAVRGANLFAIVADNSRGLDVADSGAATTRATELRAVLAGDSSAWLASLADTFQVRPYVFDRGLRRVGDFTALDFQGDASALGASLARLRERFAGQPLAGILLFTDGIATDLAADALPDLAGLPPVYPVVVGRGEVRDVRVERASVRQTAFDDAPVTVQADVTGHDLAGRALEVSVRALAAADATSAADTTGAAATRPLPPPQTIQLRRDEQPSPVSFAWRPGGSGIQFYQVDVTAAGAGELDEATTLNNRRAVVVDRGRAAYRILYVGGRPGWEFKFLNRALLDDPQLDLVALLRVARREPKFEFKGRAGEATNPMFRGFDAEEQTPRYDQPVLVRVNTRDADELRGGFPLTAEELFAYDAVVLDDVEAGFFRFEQLALLRRFVAERGGGLLALGGADALESGGWGESPLAAALPLYLDRRAATPPIGRLTWSLTREGWLEPWVRVRAVEDDEIARLSDMPGLLVAHGLDATKPGATVLAQVTDEAGQVFPVLAAQNFGAGRVAALTAGDLWRWGLRDEVKQADLARFWRQLARWLVTDVPAQVTLQVRPRAGGADTAAGAGGGVQLRVTARDTAYRPADLATARLTVRRFRGEGEPADDTRFKEVTLTAEPVADAAGVFAAEFGARDAGAYLAEVEVTGADGALLGRAQAGWVVDPAAEEFRTLAPNRALLAEIARRTGGEVVEMTALDTLVDRLPTRSAPITETWSRPVWHNAWVFLAVLGCFVAEWVWRRRKGLP